MIILVCTLTYIVLIVQAGKNVITIEVNKMYDQKILEQKVVELSKEVNQHEKVMLFEYMGYVEAGLQPTVAYQFMEFKYTNKIKGRKYEPEK